MVNIVKQKIVKIIESENITIAEEKINSKTSTVFEFKIGEETYIVKLVPAYYGLKEIQERRRKLPPPPLRSLETEDKEEDTEHLLEFHPPENIGLLLSFLPTDFYIDDDPETIERIVPEGYILSTGRLQSELVGYKSIILECEGEGGNYTFCERINSGEKLIERDKT